MGSILRAKISSPASCKGVKRASEIDLEIFQFVTLALLNTWCSQN